jgi:tetratricopeptide (TPR) repeat protein
VERDRLLSKTERPDELVIRARQAYDDVLADPDRFGPAAQALVAEARRARQPEALALALRAVAWAERARLDDRSAIALLDEACRIARRHHLDDTLAELLMTHAAVSQELGWMAAARRDLRAAAALLTGPRARELDFNQAVLLQNVGQLTDAAAIYHQVLSDPSTGPRHLVLSANNLALIESEQGRYGAALQRLGQALPAAADIGPALLALLTESQAWVTVQSGRFTAGLTLFEQAAQAYQAAGLALGEHYVEYADALMELRLLPEATRAARQAVRELSSTGARLMAAEAQLRVARLALLAGDPAEADSAAAAAAEAFGRQARAGWRSRALVVEVEARLGSGTATRADLARARAAASRMADLGATSAAVQGFLVTGRLAASLGQRRQAVAALTRAGTLARRAPVLVRLRGRLSCALAARLRQRDREVLLHCQQGLADLARHRRSLPSAELRALASGHGAELGRIGLDVVLRNGSPARALNWMERSRAAALLAVEPPQFGEISADLKALRAVHAELRDRAAPATRPAAAGPTRAEQAIHEQTVIEDRIRQATWRAAPVAEGPARPVTLSALRDHLGGRLLVEYGLLDEALVAVVVEPRRSRIVSLGPLGPVREQLRALLFALRRLAQSRPPAQLDAARASAEMRLRRLAEVLLRPLGLSCDAELVIVPVPDLQGVPWAALHSAPVGLAPSATAWTRSALAAQTEDPAGTDGKDVALVAGPDLPGAVAEVEALAGIYPSAARITPPASAADRVVDALAGASLVHLACHGTLRADNPMFSSLLLSDGPLTVQELYARGLAPRRLVLAACESGSLVGYPGDEVLGFVSALLARGTAGIIASTSAVPDVEAVDLMTAVHRRLAGGDTLARALHEARGSTGPEDPASFVNWCTFNAHGAA